MLKEVLRSFKLLTVKTLLNILSEDVAHTHPCNLLSANVWTARFHWVHFLPSFFGKKNPPRVGHPCSRDECLLQMCRLTSLHMPGECYVSRINSAWDLLCASAGLTSAWGVPARRVTALHRGPPSILVASVLAVTNFPHEQECFCTLGDLSVPVNSFRAHHFQVVFVGNMDSEHFFCVFTPLNPKTSSVQAASNTLTCDWGNCSGLDAEMAQLFPLCAFPGVFKILAGLYLDMMCLNGLKGHTMT